MFDALLRRLTAPAPNRLPEPDARLALAALLVRLARSDRDYTAAEISRIDRVLGELHGMSPTESAALRTEAEAFEVAAPDTVRFTRALKEAVALERRQALLEALWAVALADGKRDENEEALLRLVVSLLGLTDQESAFARQRVERRG